MSLSKHRFNNFVLLVIGALLVVSGTTAGIYSIKERRQLNAVRDTKQAELETIKEKLRALPDLNAEYLRLDGEMNRLATFIPTREGQAEFIKELQDLADNCNITIKSCHVKPEISALQKLPDYAIYKWDLTVTSGYRELLDFIQALSRAGRFIKVANMDVRSSGGDLKTMNIAMTLDLISKSALEKVNS